MKKCPNCGNKLGFFNRQYNCKNCNKAICDKCLIWKLMEIRDTKYGWEDEISREYVVCSDECAFKSYYKFAESLDKSKEYLVTNTGNVGIDVTEAKEDDGRGFSIHYMGTNPRKLSNEPNLIPQLKHLYERIIKDLKKRKINYKEDYMDI